MKHEPLKRQITPWLGRPDMKQEIMGITAHWFRRSVSDGSLWACVAHEPDGWHLSISFRDIAGAHTRYPSWDEQVDACRQLLPAGLTLMMLLPPDGPGYVSLHPTTMHWHEARCTNCGVSI